jgi:hypothetical protein
MTRQSVVESKARLEADIRAIAAEHKGQPLDYVARVIRQRLNAAVDRDFLATLLAVPPFRPQTKWETRQEQVDLIGRSVEVPGADGLYGSPGCGFGDVIAYRRTNQGDQVKVRRLYGEGVKVYFLSEVRRSGIPEAVAEQM